MRHIIAIAIAIATAVACLVFAGSAAAQDADRQALAERFVEITLADMDRLMEGVVTEMVAGFPKEVEGDERAWFAANTPSIMSRHMQSLIDAVTAEYARLLTAEELRALIDFYDTPQGRVIASKQAEAGVAAGGQTAQFQIDFFTELSNKFCAEFDCDAMGQTATTAKTPPR